MASTPARPACIAGAVHPFDRYRLDDPERAERIESCLVALATGYLNAAAIENDDPDDAALERALGRPAPILPP